MYRVPGVKNPKAHKPIPFNNKFNKNIPSQKTKIPTKDSDKKS